MSEPSTSLTRLAHAIALFLLGGQPSEALPSIAADALAEGADVPGLADLAGLSNSTTSGWDFEQAVDPLLSAFGLRPTEGRFLEAPLRLVAAGIAAGDIDPFTGCEAISTSYRHSGMQSSTGGTYSALLAIARDSPDRRTAVAKAIVRVSVEYSELGFIGGVTLD